MILGIVAGANRLASVQALIVPHDTASPYVAAYPVSAAGFGASSFLGFAQTPYGISITKAGSAAVITTGFGSGSALSRRLSGAAFGTIINAMPYTGDSQGQGADFNKDDSLVAVATSLTPFITVANWNNTTGFGSKLASPTSLPGGSAWRPKFVYT